RLVGGRCPRHPASTLFPYTTLFRSLVGTRDEIEIEEAAGEARDGVPATVATRFDYASVTKPFMATLALVLDAAGVLPLAARIGEDRKSTRLNSSHLVISNAVFCLKK